ncbi:MAG: PA2779 family protein [Pseudomonadales bacterium]|nr:PA2779 family protein [Halioglobus sp.]MCP5123010.1 PA2779 family protein [Pseudomonadales bacterium]
MNYRKFIAFFLSATLAWAGLTASAAAAVVGTSEALALERPGVQLAAVQAGLARSEVQQAMVQLGVDPVEAQLRVAALGERELAQLQGRLDQLPAGGIFALIGAVFVVLLILELTGVIDIFKKV